MKEEADRIHRIFEACLDPEDGLEAGFALLRGLGVSKEEAKGVLGVRTSKRPAPFPPVTFLELFLLDACNLRCGYCFVKGKTHRRRMSLETAQAAFEFLLQTSRGGRELSLLFFGGEPLLAMPLLRELLPWIQSRAAEEGRSVRLDMTTNGTLLDEEKVRFLRKHGTKLLLSLDGGPSTHDLFRKFHTGEGSFERCMQALSLVKKYQGFVGAKVTTMPETADHLDGDVRELHSRGVSFFILGHATGVPWSDERIEAYIGSLRRLFLWWIRKPAGSRPRIPWFEESVSGRTKGKRHHWGCRAGRTGLAVDPDGTLYPCSKLISGEGGALQLGNVFEGIVEVDLRRRLCGLDPEDRHSCWNCFFRKLCSGGCYAVNLVETGDPFHPGDDCRMLGRRYLLSLEFRRLSGPKYGSDEIDSRERSRKSKQEKSNIPSVKKGDNKG